MDLWPPALFLYFVKLFSFIFAVFMPFFERGEHATIAWRYSAIQAAHDDDDDDYNDDEDVGDDHRLR
jgi:hypothetical protein